MGEAVRHLVMLIWAFSAIESNAQAQPIGTYIVQKEAPADSKVVVYGSANEEKGLRNTYLLEQNTDENPLGNPIEPYSGTFLQDKLQAPEKANWATQSTDNIIQENLLQNPKISPQESPQIVNKQIQNTLYESGGRIYDVQSYPATDINYIEKPNLNPTITTYPAY